jgi:hypothetical protein
MNLLIALAAVALVAAAGYAQHQIPRYTAGNGRVWFLRGVLAVVGLLVGYASARYATDPGLAFPGFLIGFGAVHVPAAFILFLKHERGAAKS